MTWCLGREPASCRKKSSRGPSQIQRRLVSVCTGLCASESTVSRSTVLQVGYDTAKRTTYCRCWNVMLYATRPSATLLSCRCLASRFFLGLHAREMVRPMGFRDVLLLERVVGETDRMNPCCDMGCFDCCSPSSLRVLSASDKGHT